MEFNNMLKDIEKLNLNTNNNKKYIQKDIIFDKNYKDEKEINKNIDKFYSD